MHGCRAAIALIIAAALCVGATSNAAAAGESKALLAISVNTVEKGLYLTKVTDDDDVLVKRDDLVEAGVDSKVFQSNLVNPSGFVSLKSLAPNVTFKLDVDKLTIGLTVAPQFLGHTSLDLHGGDSIELSSARSAFLNYAVSQSLHERPTLSGEFGAYLRGGMLLTTFSDSGGRFRRGISSWTLDRPGQTRRYVLGDTYTDTGDLGGSASIEGLSVARNFGLEPDGVRTVLPRMSGYVATPSTAEIYVNGVLVARKDLDPGSFDLSSLPVVNGVNTAQVVIRDAFGHTQTLSKSFYQSSVSLKPGVSDYAFGLGFIRDTGTGRQTPVFADRYRVGISDNLTGGGRIEIGRDLVSGGPKMDIRTRFGELSMAAAASRAGGYSGNAAVLGYSYTGRRFGVSAAAGFQSPHYANMSQDPLADRSLFNASLGLGLSISRQQAVSVQFTGSRDRDRGMTSQISAGTAFRLARGMSLSLNLQRGRSAGITTNAIFTGLNFAVGRQMQSSVTADITNGKIANSISIARSATEQQPLGYGFSATREPGALSTSYNAEYLGRYGRYEVVRDDIAGASTVQMSAAGSIVYIDGGVMLSIPINDGYALVDTNGLANVGVYANNQLVGHTNRHGRMLVPSLSSYYANKIEITTADAPLNYNFKQVKQTVAPTFRGGAVAKFGLYRIQAFLGSVSITARAKDIVPAYGLLTLDLGHGKKAVSDLGENGEFYLENVNPGRYAALIESAKASCSFSIVVPDTNGSYVRLGKLVCIASTKP